MQLKESGIPPTTGIRKPSSTDKEFGFTSWNPESKTVLYSLKWDVKSRPRSHSSKAISDVTSPVKLVGEICALFQAFSGNSDSANWPGYEAS